MSDTIYNTQKRIKTYKFYKYRTLHSSCPTEWKTVQIPEDYTPKEYFDEIASAHSWSEHFHGVEWKRCKPSKKWLENQILHMRDQCNHISRVADDYCFILNAYDNTGRSTRKTAKAI